MVTQQTETLRQDLCPHCDDVPLRQSRELGGEPVLACDACGCEFSRVGLELRFAGDGCPIAAMADPDEARR